MLDSNRVSTPCRKCGASEWRYRKRGDRECIPCHVARQAARRAAKQADPPECHIWSTTAHCRKCGQNNWRIRNDGVTRDCRVCQARRKTGMLPTGLGVATMAEPNPARSSFDAKMRQVVVADTGCWVAPATSGESGYSLMRGDDRPNMMFHRRVYEEFVGPIPAGMHAHHKCLVRACCNPSHIQVLTPAQHNAVHAQMRKG